MAAAGGKEAVMSLLIGLLTAGVVLACLFVLALCRAAGSDYHYPDVTSRDAMAKLLDKAKAEQDWLAEHAQG
jgi:hypothetical protein